MVEIAHMQYSKDPSGFEKLFNDAEKPLYEGCKKFTKLFTLVNLYNLKVRHGWSNISFSELLKALKDILPSPNDLPTSMYEAKKMLGSLGMEYEKIHACPNDCCLYRKEYANAIMCHECGESRWKYGKDANKKKKIPAKIIEIDDKLRHLADSPAWKLVDTMWPNFSYEPRNLRLALSADGINPISDMSSKYSCWPVVMVIYNLPPWLCTLLDILGKTKNGLNARSDLADLKIRPELTPINGEKKNFIPPACYTLTKKEKRFLLKSLSEMKVPQGYSSNVTKLVSIEDSKLNGLKSHDCHVLLQQLLPVAIKFVLPKHRVVLMTSKQDQLVVASYNPGDHWSLVIINPYDDVVYHLDSLRTSSRDDIKYVTNMALTIFQSQKNLKKTRKTTFWKACPLQVGTVECGYYVMRYMREIVSKDTSIITNAIDTRNSYSQLELDEVRVEWAELLSRYI
ncbi:hypothetical protein E5676_scaffold108G00910 [Cucumis melo var. makuwa]|uniref:Ubiquitin-like protease family profile domain-containing protein n=1 Tax=Cucumis melo var. makuwa TaxID=1194695 RepID=A0A5A7TMR8_CUCMM|nr:hypothetical protein E6C27_scaffold44G003860 [Cucumis melo var. makuwa]TYK05274.1 hypothetical protein E5676_scaffold108G00910 [Cucumis melo var. makuwa]